MTSTPNFAHLKAAEIDPTTPRPYKIVDLDPSPTIWLKPATSANKPFWAETLKRINARNQGGRRAQRLTPASTEESRAEDCVLIAKYCATKWDEKVVDASGKPVPFSIENCTAYFQALPDYIFDGIRGFATEPTNFVDAAESALGEA